MHELFNFESPADVKRRIEGTRTFWGVLQANIAKMTAKKSTQWCSG